MLDVEARDGAGRVARLRVGERTLATPAVFWLAERHPAGAPGWEPVLDHRPNPDAVLEVVPRFTDPVPNVGESQLLLRRTLAPTASMMEGSPRLEHLADVVSVWGDALDLSRDPKRFAPALARARAAAGFGRALYTPGLGEPAHLALLAYSGVDLFDAIPLLHAAARGTYLTAAGSFDADRLAEPECACPACHTEAPATFTEAEIAAHNQWAARTELGVVRNALRGGRLRELVEARARAHPELTALLRRLDAEYEFFERRVPVHRSTPLWANTKESLARVECRRFRERVRTRYRPPPSPPILLLLPCSARKPYSRSRTHRAIAESVWNAGAAGLVHEVVVTSPLGLVPRELELAYPAAHYDVPVTGEWDEEEGAMIRALLAHLLAQRPYARVVSHLPRRTYEIVEQLLPTETLVTCETEQATAAAALKRLELVLRQLAKEFPAAPLPRLQLERLRALADWQFGPAASDGLLADARAAGRWPHVKLLYGDRQLGLVPPERGLLSLTLAGAERLLATGTYRVEVDDFDVKGSVFAVGVLDADDAIRPGDEVALHHRGRLKGVGVARMSGREMTELRRGEAVHVRHHA